MGGGGAAHTVPGVGDSGRREAWNHPSELRAEVPGGACTWSSSLRRVMRWKGRIRKDLRDRRWQTGSLSSFSRTSRKLLLVFLRRQGASG